jgi:cysteinyl-tRNA synthetase
MHKKFGPIDQKYADVLTEYKIKFDQALKDNINTSNAIKVLHGLGGDMFTYVKHVEEVEKCSAKELILDTLDFIKKMLELFGLKFEKIGNDDKLLGVISTIRTDIRDLAKEVGAMIKPLDKDLAKKVVVSLYGLTDRIRDHDLPAIGISLTDK